MAMNKAQTREEDDTVWYFAYASSMTTATLCKQMGGSPPLESLAVGLHDAWLSFDYLGLPYVEPAYASLIIRGINDGPFAGTDKRNPEEPEYKRYLRERCCPGISSSDEMELPPFAEGIAHLVMRDQLARLASTSGFRLAPVQCRRLNEGDNRERTGEQFQAMTLVAKEKYRSSHLMPSMKSYIKVYRGALVSQLSGQYVGRLTLLRPYNPEHGGKKAQLAQRLFKALVLLPQFLTLYLPLVGAQRVFGRHFYARLEYLKQEVGDWIRWTSIFTERWIFRPVFGDIAYAIEQD